jgi:hypothetical protein
MPPPLANPHSVQYALAQLPQLAVLIKNDLTELVHQRGKNPVSIVIKLPISAVPMDTKTKKHLLPPIVAQLMALKPQLNNPKVEWRVLADKAATHIKLDVSWA